MTVQEMLDTCTGMLDVPRFVTQKTNKSGVVSVLFFGKLGLRLYSGPKGNFIELSQGVLHADYDRYGLRFEERSDGYVRFYVAFPSHLSGFSTPINHSWDSCRKDSVESFGCCSSFLQCSDQLRCLHEEDASYYGCSYMGNLRAGRIFYGKNRNV